MWGCPNCECTENGEVACKGRNRYCKLARDHLDSINRVKRGKTKKGCAFRGKDYDVGDEVHMWGCPNCECSENGEVACKGRNRYCKLARDHLDSINRVKRGDW